MSNQQHLGNSAQRSGSDQGQQQPQPPPPQLTGKSRQVIAFLPVSALSGLQHQQQYQQLQVQNQKQAAAQAAAQILQQQTLLKQLQVQRKYQLKLKLNKKMDNLKERRRRELESKKNQNTAAGTEAETTTTATTTPAAAATATTSTGQQERDQTVDQQSAGSSNGQQQNLTPESGNLDSGQANDVGRVQSKNYTEQQRGFILMAIGIAMRDLEHDLINNPTIKLGHGFSKIFCAYVRDVLAEPLFRNKIPQMTPTTPTDHSIKQIFVSFMSKGQVGKVKRGGKRVRLEDRQVIMDLLENHPREKGWSIRTLARETGLSKSFAQRVLNEYKAIKRKRPKKPTGPAAESSSAPTSTSKLTPTQGQSTTLASSSASTAIPTHAAPLGAVSPTTIAVAAASTSFIDDAQQPELEFLVGHQHHHDHHH